ncbi:MAG: hypothetical protein ACFHX7_21935 [Pseudomonadota bacterium]
MLTEEFFLAKIPALASLMCKQLEEMMMQTILPVAERCPLCDQNTSDGPGMTSPIVACEAWLHCTVHDQVFFARAGESFFMPASEDFFNSGALFRAAYRDHIERDRRLPELPVVPIQWYLSVAETTLSVWDSDCCQDCFSCEWDHKKLLGVYLVDGHEDFRLISHQLPEFGQQTSLETLLSRCFLLDEMSNSLGDEVWGYLGESLGAEVRRAPED